MKKNSRIKKISKKLSYLHHISIIANVDMLIPLVWVKAHHFTAGVFSVKSSWKWTDWKLIANNQNVRRVEMHIGLKTAASCLLPSFRLWQEGCGGAPPADGGQRSCQGWWGPHSAAQRLFLRPRRGGQPPAVSRCRPQRQGQLELHAAPRGCHQGQNRCLHR